MRSATNTSESDHWSLRSISALDGAASTSLPSLLSLTELEDSGSRFSFESCEPTEFIFMYLVVCLGWVVGEFWVSGSEEELPDFFETNWLFPTKRLWEEFESADVSESHDAMLSLCCLLTRREPRPSWVGGTWILTSSWIWDRRQRRNSWASCCWEPLNMRCFMAELTVRGDMCPG